MAQNAYKNDPEHAKMAIKGKFRQLDSNRDGMLDINELTVMLKKGRDDITDQEIQALFSKVDVDGSGRVTFNEFVDFIFAPKGAKKPTTQKEIYEARVKAMASLGDDMLREVNSLEVVGAQTNFAVNGTFSKCFDETFNGKAVFDRGYPEMYMFYGWTPGRKRVGWFIARRKPQQGRAVQRYRQFNPSPLADSPHLCYAMWITSDGVPEKTLFCSAVDRREWDDSCQEGECRPEELCGEEGLARTLIPSGSCAGADEDDGYGQMWADPSAQDANDGDDVDDNAFEGGEESEEAGPQPEPFEDGFDLSCAAGADGSRPLTLITERARLFHMVNPADVVCEDGVSNYWFFAACAAVAEYPAWIQSMFGQAASVAPDNKYTVRLYHPGKKAFQKVEINDTVPTKGGGPAFAGISLDGEIWCSLLEKAFCKFTGGYSKGITTGRVIFGLLYLVGGGDAESWRRASAGKWLRSYTKWTGQANDTVDRENAETVEEDGVVGTDDEIWALLRTYMELCYPVACKLRADMGDCGLEPDRHYSLLGAREVRVGDKTLRMIFLRNPFGVGEWKGRWSDGDAAWQACAAARNQLRATDAPDGTFWMSYAAFKDHFEQIDVAQKSMPVQGSHPVKLVGLRRGLGLSDQ